MLLRQQQPKPNDSITLRLGVKPIHRRYYLTHLLISQDRIERQTYDFAMQLIGNWKRIDRPLTGIGNLPMGRYGIMNVRADTLLMEVFPKLVATGVPNDK